MNYRAVFNKTKPIFILLAIAGFAVALFYFLPFEQRHKENAEDEGFGWKFPVAQFTLGPENQVAYSNFRDKNTPVQGLPVRLKIPIIGVDSAIEDAFITSDGRMDVPEGSTNVAWFALGPHPGDKGSAVIGGHFGIQNGVKFVFYDLNKLVVGDKVYVVNDKGETLAFQVRRIQLFERNADGTTIFSSTDGLAHLNLITCEGIWNKVAGTYPLRRVVFTDAVPLESVIAPATVPLTASINQTLRVVASNNPPSPQEIVRESPQANVNQILPSTSLTLPEDSLAEENSPKGLFWILEY